MTALAMLAQEVGVNERTLRRAVNQGTLRAARPTPRALELPLTERRYVRRSWSLLAALRAALRTEQNVRFALLFGSAATGTDTPASDVDIAVELRDPSLERVVDLSAKLTAAVGRRVDVIRVRDAEADPLFLADVVADGRVLVDREGLWRTAASAQGRSAAPGPEAASRPRPSRIRWHRPPAGRVRMADGEPMKADRKRWERDVVRHLEDFPRQYAALETAMAAFGEDFDPQAFRVAFNTTEDLEAYNRAQAVERAVGRVQNFVAELAIAGARLAQLPLPPMGDDGSRAQQAFEALRDAGVIGGELCRRLTRAQRARSMIEHSYVQTPAGDVHRAAELVHEVARDFIGPYRAWIPPHIV